MPRLLDHPTSLWPGHEPCRFNNCISYQEAAAHTSSLLFIRTSRLIVSSQPTLRGGAARQTHKAKFTYNGTDYCLTLTDPAAIGVIKTGLKQYHLDDVFLTVSLTEPYLADDAEKEPLDCHRTILVARHLSEAGIAVQHIHEDDHLESHPDAIVRLAQSLKLRENQLNFFRSSKDLFADASALQEKRIGYDSAAEGSTLESIAG